LQSKDLGAHRKMRSFCLYRESQIGICRSDDRCYFLVSEQESNQRNRLKGGFLQRRPPLESPSETGKARRISTKCASVPTCALPNYPGTSPAEQTCRFVKCKRSKIGTFLNAGWRCGGWILKEGAFARSASLSRLLWGTFLAETRKVRKLNVSTNCNLNTRAIEPGEAGGVG